MRIANSKKGTMAIKVNLEKLYDRLNWGFLQETLVLAGLPKDLVTLIMHCVSSVNISILWNGETIDPFVSSKGFKQGDPFSPYLFVLYMERLAHVIKEEVLAGNWIPFLVSRNGPKIFHLYFINDLILFGESSTNQMNIILQCLERFCLASGAKVSIRKTKLFCFRNIKS